VVEEVAGVVLGGVNLVGCSHESGIAYGVFRGGLVQAAFYADAVGYLYLENLDLGLFNGEVSELDIETVEMDAADALIDVLAEFALADVADESVVGECAGLVEFAEELVDLEGCVVGDELVPEAASLHLTGLSFIIIDDLLEIPGEGQHVCMLLLIEHHVHSELLVFLLQLHCAILLLFELEVSSGEGSNWHLGGHTGEHSAGGTSKEGSL